MIFPLLFIVLIAVDGFNIFTINWQKVNAEVITVEYEARTFHSRYKGSESKVFSNAQIKYYLDGKEHFESLLINYKVDIGQNIEIRLNNNKITASKLSYNTYLLLLLIIIVYIIVFTFLDIIPKFHKKRSMKNNKS